MKQFIKNIFYTITYSINKGRSFEIDWNLLWLDHKYWPKNIELLNVTQQCISTREASGFGTVEPSETHESKPIITHTFICLF